MSSKQSKNARRKGNRREGRGTGENGGIETTEEVESLIERQERINKMSPIEQIFEMMRLMGEGKIGIDKATGKIAPLIAIDSSTGEEFKLTDPRENRMKYQMEALCYKNGQAWILKTVAWEMYWRGLKGEGIEAWLLAVESGEDGREEIEGMMIGFDAKTEKYNFILIDSAVIDEGERRKGKLREMMRYIDMRYSGRDIYLEILPKSELPLIEIWEKVGFKVSTKSPKMIGIDNPNAIIMEKISSSK